MRFFYAYFENIFYNAEGKYNIYMILINLFVSIATGELMYNINEVGKRIKYLRNKKGISQEQLAEETYVSTEMVSRWERGKNSPSIDCLVTLACVLECTLDYLILGDYFINKVYGMYISDDKVDLVKRVVAELIK